MSHANDIDNIIEINTPIEVLGKRCILMADSIVADDKSDPDRADIFVCQGSDRHGKIIANHDKLKQLKSEYQLPVYGIVSFLFANNAFSSQHQFQILKLPQQRGLYVLFNAEGKAYESGLFSGSIIPAHFDLNLEDAYVVELEKLHIKNMPRQIFTKEERLSTLNKQQSQTWKNHAYIIFACVAIGLGAAFLYNNITALDENKQTELQTELNALNKQLAQIKANLAMSHKKSTELAPLLLALSVDEKLSSVGEIKIGAGSFAIALSQGDLAEKITTLTNAFAWYKQADNSMLGNYIGEGR